MLWYYTEGLPYSLSGIGKLIYKDANSNTKASLAHKEQRFFVSRRMRSATLRVMNLHLVIKGADSIRLGHRSLIPSVNGLIPRKLRLVYALVAQW